MGDGFDTVAAREAAEKARLYTVHKAHGSLGTFYYLYPENAPSEYQYPPPRQRDDGGREC
jgi:hypothetical protein